jgi:hypothetical protein
MDAKTLEALKASIAKWERNAEAETPAQYLTSGSDCPLCEMFVRYMRSEGVCTGCPVFGATSQKGCFGTPFHAADDARYAWVYNEGTKEAAHEAARAEVDFLKSLLPAEAAQ